MKKMACCALGLLAAVLSGCGDYMMKPSIPDDIRTVAIPPFKNKTDRPGVEQDLTQRVIQNFNADGRLTVAALERADSLLEGTIQQYVLLPLLRDANQVPQQYKLQVTVDLVFTDLKKKVQLWDTSRTVDLTPVPTSRLEGSYDSINTSSIKEMTTYYVLNTLGVTPEDETTARQRVFDQISRRVISRTLDGF